MALQRGAAVAGRNIAALGFRAHTGWAAVVALTPEWKVLERRRLAYEPEPTRFIYHHVAEVASDGPEALIEKARAQATEKARCEIETLLLELRGNGKHVASAGVPGGNARLPASLAEIIAAHSRIHAAEGAFYRDVLATACERAGLRVKRTPERDLWAAASKAVGAGAEGLRDRVVEMGKQLGPPWGEDQKLAALAALVALKA
jgi:hypothetical protein